MLRTLILLYEPRLARQTEQSSRNIARLRRWHSILLLASTARLHILHRICLHPARKLLRLGRRRLRIYVGLRFARHNDGQLLPKNGLNSSFASSWSTFCTQTNNNDPYTICLANGTGGHVVLGFRTNQAAASNGSSTWAKTGSFICHDPYGDYNGASYPNWDGRYSTYDWPGYSNGYKTSERSTGDALPPAPSPHPATPRSPSAPRP